MTPRSAAYGVNDRTTSDGQVGQVDALGRLLGVLELRREQEVRDDVGHGLGVVDELVDLGQTRAGGWGRARRRPRGADAAPAPAC